MKKIILILIMFLLILTTYSKERIEDKGKLEVRDKIVYVVGEDKPYTGTFIEKNKFGSKFREMKYEKGVIQESKIYFKSGKIASILVFENGKPHGIYKNYHSNGRLKEETSYKNGKKDGFHRMYDEKENLWLELKYKNGVKISQ